MKHRFIQLFTLATLAGCDADYDPEMLELQIPLEERSWSLCSNKIVQIDASGNQLDIHGTLCKPFWGSDTVEILVHGATYDRNYWITHVPVALLSGRATFAYDRLGSGASSKPPGETVSIDLSAFVNSKVIESLKDGSIGNFENVVQIGHSFGSLISVTSASTYQDVNALILTGFAHQATEQANAATAASVYPAMYDPKFAGVISDPFYFTTIPGTRQSLFFSDDVEPWVLELDEERKDLLPLSLVFEIPRHYSMESLAISVPTYMIMGQEDFIYCGEAVNCSDEVSYFEYESDFFNSQLTTDLVQGAGHALTLHNSTFETSIQIESWIDSVI